MTTTALDLDTLHLAAGGHNRRGDGVCLLEAVAWFAGEPHSAAPTCVSPVLRALGMRLNDRLPDDRRQELKHLIPRLVGTAGDGLDETRGYMALEWLIRTYTPAWLDLAGLTTEAQTLRDLRRIADLVASEAARPVVQAAREKAREKRRAAAASSAAAYADAADAAAYAAYADAADAAAYAASSADAAAYAAYAAYADAAAYAASSAAAYAADAADAAAYAASSADAAAYADDDWQSRYDAAYEAATARLAPTVAEMQTSVIGLFEAMIQPGQP